MKNLTLWKTASNVWDKKKAGQNAVVYHYCNLSSFFWLRRYKRNGRMSSVDRFSDTFSWISNKYHQIVSTKDLEIHCFKVVILEKKSHHSWLNRKTFFFHSKWRLREENCDFQSKSIIWERNNEFILTANIFESGPMTTPWKLLAGLPLLPNCKLG